MSDSETPDPGESTYALSAMQREIQDVADLHFAISEFEQAELLLDEYLTTLVEVRLRMLPDEQFDIKLAEDILMSEAVARTMRQRSRILISLARKLSGPGRIVAGA